MTRPSHVACCTALLVFSAAAGCRDKPRPTPTPLSTASAAASSGTNGAFYRNGVVTFPFGVELPAPVGTKVDEASEADTWIVENGSWSVVVSRAAPSAPKTAEAALAHEREKDPAAGDPPNWKPTKLLDGYAVTYDIDSRMNHTYFGEVYRDFGDVAVSCVVSADWKWGEEKGPVAKKRGEGVDACKELRRKR